MFLFLLRIQSPMFDCSQRADHLTGQRIRKHHGRSSDGLKNLSSRIRFSIGMNAKRTNSTTTNQAVDERSQSHLREMLSFPSVRSFISYSLLSYKSLSSVIRNVYAGNRTENKREEGKTAQIENVIGECDGGAANKRRQRQRNKYMQQI